MTNLLDSGFTMNEVVRFLSRSHIIDSGYVSIMKNELEKGGNLSDILIKMKFSQNIIAQVALSEDHGRLLETLSLAKQYLLQVIKVRKKLIEVMSYPLLLLAFLVIIVIGLRQYLLPQLESKNTATLFISHLPTVFILVISIFIMGGILFAFFTKRMSRIAYYGLLARLPFVGRLTRIYVTALYAREWGILLVQGVDLHKIVTIMQEQENAFFAELGDGLAEGLYLGQSFSSKIASYPFFQSELELIIEYGEIKSKLGKELMLYADECWDRFFYKINRYMQWIQPAVFILVSIVIVLIYAAMLLPIYQNMEVTL